MSSAFNACCCYSITPCKVYGAEPPLLVAVCAQSDNPLHEIEAISYIASEYNWVIRA